MRYADLHADTPYRMFHEHLSFTDNRLHISKEHMAPLGDLFQIFACFCHDHDSDEQVYRDFFRMRDNFLREVGCLGEDVRLRFLFSVEDARLLCGDLSRLDVLYAMGVRILTPVWGGLTHIGGAFDTDTGLTPFGKSAVKRACTLGIFPDLSHSSEETADDISEIAGLAGISTLATHSNAYGVYTHPRNLRDRHLAAVRDSGGLIGISMTPYHLTPSPDATSDDVLRHITYYLDRGCAKVLAFGCDFDGIGKTPLDIPNVSAMPVLADKLLAHGIPEETVTDIFGENIRRFFRARGLLPDS